MSNWKKRLLQAVSIFVVLIIGWLAFSNWDDRRVLKSLLNLSELPKSVTVLTCKSCAMTDVISVCSFKVSSEDVNHIISRYPYKEDSALLPYSHTGCGGVKPYFKPSVALEYRPPEFKHGGWIRLFLNED